MASQVELLFSLFLMAVASWVVDCDATAAFEPWSPSVHRLPLLRGRASLRVSESSEGMLLWQHELDTACLFHTIEDQNPTYNKSDMWVGRQVNVPRFRSFPATPAVEIATLRSLCNGQNGLEAGSYKFASSVEEMVQYARSKLGSAHQLEALQTSSSRKGKGGSAPADDEDERSMTITQVASKKGMCSTTTRSNYTTTVVCHDVSNVLRHTLFLCRAMSNVESILEAKLISSDGKLEASALIQCYEEGGVGDGESRSMIMEEEKVERRCEWMSEDTVVWMMVKEELLLKKNPSVSSSRVWANEKKILSEEQEARIREEEKRKTRLKRGFFERVQEHHHHHHI